MNTIDWLLDSDPAIRWQVLQDLVHARPEIVEAERARVASDGWGARLIALQGADGQWAGGACFPAGWSFDQHPGEGQDWTSTLPTLHLLTEFGIEPRSEKARAAISAVRAGCRWEHAGQPFFAGEVEPCINGRTVAIGVYFGLDMEELVARLLDEQLEDGGWNCEAENGSVRSSFATTINVLEGLLGHERATGGSARSIAARRGGEEYLLERGLFRRRSTGEVVRPEWLQFSFPTQWHYDVLRALDYFRRVGDEPDKRLEEAVELVRAKRQPDDCWLLENTHPGEVHFPLEDGDGRPSRWNTLRALRVLEWYEKPTTRQARGEAASNNNHKAPDCYHIACMRPIVVKIGGSTLGQNDTALEDIAALAADGTPMIVVHGGGSAATDWLKIHGVTSEFVDGLRVTGPDAIDVVVAVFAGLVNKDLVASFRNLGANPVGISGVDGGLIATRQADARLGFVGEVTSVDRGLVDHLLAAGYLPVISCVGFWPDGGGHLMNINADTVAGEVAAAVEASELHFLTDVPAVRGVNGEDMDAIGPAEVAALIASGAATSGMIPKLKACARAAAAGVTCHIIDGREPHALRDALNGKPLGTLVTA